MDEKQKDDTPTVGVKLLTRKDDLTWWRNHVLHILISAEINYKTLSARDPKEKFGEVQVGTIQGPQGPVPQMMKITMGEQVEKEEKMLDRQAQLLKAIDELLLEEKKND